MSWNRKFLKMPNMLELRSSEGIVLQPWLWSLRFYMSPFSWCLR